MGDRLYSFRLHENDLVYFSDLAGSEEVKMTSLIDRKWETARYPRSLAVYKETIIFTIGDMGAYKRKVTPENVVFVDHLNDGNFVEY